MASVTFTPLQIQFLHSLGRNKVRFLVVGLSSAVLQGATVTTQDVELWVENLGSEEFVTAVKSAGGFYIPPGLVDFNPPLIGPDELRVFDLVTHMHGLKSFVDEYDGGVEVTVDGVTLRLLPLERIIVSKKAANRIKDQAVMPVLESTLEVLKKLAGE
jgi:hypothetical protein